MGISKFFRYIKERYPCVTQSLKDYQIPIFDNLYLDVNGIIHECSHPNNSTVVYTSEEIIFTRIFHYIEVLFNMIQPQKLFFISVDGVAPRAKINQQRSRRFKVAKENEVLKAKLEGENGKVNAEDIFDSNCITPGTLFMAKLNKQLKYFISHKISTNELWQRCKVIFSGCEVPGEGEHKIMDYIRFMKSQPDYNPNTKHCLYGLDADLIMLSLCSHEPYFTLLREEVKYGKSQMKIQTPEETKFCLFHLSLLREYINYEFSSLKEKLQFPYDIEKIIDDWVLLGYLIGNDFIPHLPHLHIVRGAYSILYDAYMSVLPTLEGYINETGTLRLDRFEKLMEKLGRFEFLHFMMRDYDVKEIESKMGERFTESDKSICKLLKKISDGDVSENDVDNEVGSFYGSFDTKAETIEELDEDNDDDALYEAFIEHKNRYYTNKLECENIDKEFLWTQAEAYVRAIQWNLNYYYNGCCSWSWYYPYHYAPYISDIKGFKDLKLEFDLGKPFLPFEQLLAVLPPYSRKLLPEAFQSLLVDEKSPIIAYYPSDFELDLNGKQHDWEAVVILPFINEELLLDAMAQHQSKLTPEEVERNKHESTCLYFYTKEDKGVYKAPEYFPEIPHNHAELQLINYEDILVPKSKLVRGLHPNVKLDIYCPGFPTLQYVQHTASLKKAEVKVFQYSFSENMVVYVIPSPSPEKDITCVASELMGRTVFVEWPFLTEAQVIAVSTSKTKLSLIDPETGYSPENIKEEKLKDAYQSVWISQAKNITNSHRSSLSINLGEIKILVHVRLLIGRKYVFGAQEKLSFEKEWSRTQNIYPYQTIVKDIAVQEYSGPMLFKNVDDIFVPGTVCFMLGHPHYGAMGTVVEPAVSKKSGRINVLINATSEPSLEEIKQTHQNFRTEYIPGNLAAVRLNISSRLFNRVTGTIYVKLKPDQMSHKEMHNIGLNLKFNKTNEEVIGYTRKGNNHWLYSPKVIKLVNDYMMKYPDLFERLSKNFSNYFTEKMLFDEVPETLNEVIGWLKEQLQDVRTCPCGTENIEASLVKEIEETVDAYFADQYNEKLVPMQVKPHLLFKPGLHLRKAQPDASAQTFLFDRVCCVKNSFTVPLGYKGTVIGIQTAENPLETIYDVVFDRAFTCGLALYGCSDSRGYRLSGLDFINISHGQGRTVMEVNAESMESWRSPSNQAANLRANSNVFTSYKKKKQRRQSNEQKPEGCSNPWTDQTTNNEATSEDIRLGPSTPFKWKQCNFLKEPDFAGSPEANWTMNNAAQQNSAALENPQSRQSTAKPTMEFRALWNELYKSQLNKMIQRGLSSNDSKEGETTASHLTNTPSEPTKVVIQAPMDSKMKQTNKIFPKSTPQDPSAFLKAVLKIPDENTQQTAPSAPPKILSSNTVPQKENKVLDTPPLVQQLFDHARQNRKVKDEKTSTWYCSQLLHYYQLIGIGMPLYSYFTDGETNLIRAHIVLPDKRAFVSDPCGTHEQAAGSAAKKVYTELNLSNVLSNMKIPPPLHWYAIRQNNSWSVNLRPPRPPGPAGPPGTAGPPRPTVPAVQPGPSFFPPKPQPPPPQQFFQWTVKVQHNAGYHQPYKQNNQYMHHAQPKSVQSEPKSEIINSTSFVPLQAQKKCRNIVAKQAGAIKETNQSAKDNPQPVIQQKKKELPAKKAVPVTTATEKQKSTQNSSNPQERNTQPVAKLKKSRIAAKFCIPTQTEEPNLRKDLT